MTSVLVSPSRSPKGLIVHKRWKDLEVRNIPDLCPLGTLFTWYLGISVVYMEHKPGLVERLRVPREGSRYL